MPATINVKVFRVRFHDRESGYSVVVGSDEETRAEVTVVGTLRRWRSASRSRSPATPEKERFTVDFGGDLIADYTFSEADQLTLAYAATIHKTQGSEYPGVVIVLLPQHQIMLRRNLMYTAVTRGSKLVVVVGDISSVQTAVKTGRGGERCTRLKECLQRG